MLFKFWAYLAASICLSFSLYFICAQKKYTKASYTMIFLSLCIFFGGSINISKILGIENSFNTLKSDFNQTQTRINNLDVKLEQAISVKQEMSQNINIITEVRKEIANLKEAINQIYSTFQTEEFRANDLGNRIVVRKNPINPENDSVIFLELKSVPIFNSIQIVGPDGRSAPPNSYLAGVNIIAINALNTKFDKFMIDTSYYLVVKYIPDTISNNTILRARDIPDIGVGEIIKLDFNSYINRVFQKYSQSEYKETKF